jgi:O-antigen/teichoic acid export membrane protein
MASGAMWMVLAKLVERSLGLVSTLVLARVLVPHDFGIVAMAMSFVALLEMLTSFGFDTTLIQRQTHERRDWDTAWTFDILFGFAIAGLMITLAAPVATFFKEPALSKVISVLAIGSVAQGFQNIGLVAFRTEMRFDREFRFLTAKRLIAILITVPLAIALHSYWALVIGQTVGRIVSTALSYWVHPYRPRWSLAASRDLFHFSKWLLAINFVSYLKERSSDWVIGRSAGPAALGAFNVAYELASLPSTELVAPINRAVFPAYARLALESREALRTEYLSVAGMIVLLAVPAVFGVAATAPLSVPVLLGPNWGQAIPVLMLLGFFGFTNVIQSNAQATYLALGRADIPAKVNGLHVAVQLAALIPLTKAYGVVGSALAYLVTAAVMIPLSLGVALHMLKISVLNYVAKIWRPIVAAVVMYLGVAQYLRFITAPDTAKAATHLLIAVALGVAIYVMLTFGLWVLCGKPPGAEQVALARVAQTLRSKLRSRKAESAGAADT